MAGDYTRFTFDPIKGYSGVRKQQGRVSLDSDFNELEEILDRRDRAEMYDTVGQAVVPMTTPTGFQIGIVGGQLTIGIGRAYVDGILAECFGDLSSSATTLLDNHLGGVDGSGPVSYALQPFFYQPGYPGLSPTASVINLVYLDVWQREVTVFEDDALREPALNGPDTATRVQTAWQVKVLQNADANSCATPPASWAAMSAPSTARLTVLKAPAVPAPGPCVISPAGGYTGLENRLYRVEVHRAGTLAGGGGTTQATFKWSRDNASLAARVLSIGPGVLPGQSIITVSSTGRDSWMRFEPGNHVELLDDHIEYAMRESGVGGTLAKVVTVNHATGEVHVEPTVAFVPVAARHPRIRRWDIASPGEALERNATNGPPAIGLEEGITVTFGGAGADTLHAGDYWVFAARTADGSIDSVVNAPPRGILHHFARLALVTSGTVPALLSDCRIFWPRDGGCCTVVVRPGQSIQAAIDSLPAAGGCVCLKTGTHVIGEPIRIHRSNVTLHGESGGTLVSYGAAGALDIAGVTGAVVSAISVHDIRFQLGSAPGVPVAVSITRATGVRVERCSVIASGYDTGTNVGVYVGNSGAVELRDNSIGTFFYGVMVESLEGLFVARDNSIRGHRLVLAAVTISIGIAGIDVQAASGVANAHCLLEGNRVDDYYAGIRLQRRMAASVVRGNRILRNGPPDAPGTMPIDRDALRSYADSQHYAIEVEAADSTVEGNDITLPNAIWGGVRVRAPRVQVTGNSLNAPALVQAGQLMSVGIYCTTAESTADPGADACRVEANRLDGPQVAILVSRAANAAVRGNAISAPAVTGYVGIYGDDLVGGSIENNQLRGTLTACALVEGDSNACVDNDMAECGFGVLAINEADLEVRGNGIRGAQFCGLLLIPRRGATRVTDNRLQNCAWLPPAGTRSVIGSVFVFMLTVFNATSDSHLTIDSCDILDSGIAPGGAAVAATAALGIFGWTSAGAITRNRINCSRPDLLNASLEHRALALLGPVALRYALATGVVELMNGTALISDNVIYGPGATHLVEILRFSLTNNVDFRFERVAFSDNQCEHVNVARNDAHVTVRLHGGELAAVGNQVKGPTGVAGMHMDDRPRATLLGNVCTGPYQGIVAGLRPTAHLNFNF